LDDFRTFYFDTALSSSPAALPTLLAFARPGRVLFGSDWPFAPIPAGQYFANGIDTCLELGQLRAVNHTNAEALFPRLATGGTPDPNQRVAARLQRAAQRSAARFFFRLVQSGNGEKQIP
jgi:hypothetical protein